LLRGSAAVHLVCKSFFGLSVFDEVFILELR
jgi:hypothetical protein